MVKNQPVSMSTTEQQTVKNLRIHRYSPGKIMINNQVYRQPILLFKRTIHLANINHPSMLKAKDIVHWLSLYQPNLLLIGTGQEHIYLDADLFSVCHDKQVGVEVLSTDQCLRTIVALQGDIRSALAYLSP